MPACGNCHYFNAFETASSIVEANGSEFLEGSRRAAKQRELAVVAAAFDALPEEPSCETLRKDDDTPFRCPKAGYVGDILRFALGNPEVIINATNNKPVGFTAEIKE